MCVHRAKDFAVISIGNTFSRLRNYFPVNNTVSLGSCFSFSICKIRVIFQVKKTFLFIYCCSWERANLCQRHWM